MAPADSPANQKAHWAVDIGQTLGLSLKMLSEPIDWNWVLEAVDTEVNAANIQNYAATP